MTYDTRHVEFVRDSDWIDAVQQRFAVLAVGRYLAVLDVDALIESGSTAAYNPVLPRIAAALASPLTLATVAGGPAGSAMELVCLMHSDDIRSISASPFRIGHVASGGFDRRLVITDVTAGASGEILQVGGVTMVDTRFLQRPVPGLQTWQAPGSISCLKWSASDEGKLFLSTDDGAIFLYDRRVRVGSLPLCMPATMTRSPAGQHCGTSLPVVEHGIPWSLCILPQPHPHGSPWPLRWLWLRSPRRAQHIRPRCCVQHYDRPLRRRDRLARAHSGLEPDRLLRLGRLVAVDRLRVTGRADWSWRCAIPASGAQRNPGTRSHAPGVPSLYANSATNRTRFVPHRRRPLPARQRSAAPRRARLSAAWSSRAVIRHSRRRSL